MAWVMACQWAGGNTGDVVEYQGEFDRYVVTTVSGDDLAASSLVSADFLRVFKRWTPQLRPLST